MSRTRELADIPSLWRLPALSSTDRFRFFFLRVIYNLVFLIIVLLGSPYFLYRILTTARFRAGFWERFGLIPSRDRKRPCLWVHGVSVGETKAARPFVEQFAQRHPELEIVISNTTEGGQALSKKFFPTLFSFYYPLDLSWVVRRVFERVAPDGIVLMELEIWPNFLLEARQRGIPIFVVNGRLSERSFRGYKRFRKLLPQFDLVNLFSVQNEIYAQRFRGLGVEDERIQITGNVKFDEVAIAPRELPLDPELKSLFELRKDETIFVAGSTHDGEEKALCEILHQLEGESQTAPICLVLVPRHPDRKSELLPQLEQSGFSPVFLTQLRAQRLPLKKKQVLIVDTFGELEKFYSLARLVFVGGSLVERGGHNVLEPAAMGKIVFVGPHTYNFASEVSLLVGEGALVQVQDELQLKARIQEFLGQPNQNKSIGDKAIQIIRQNQGATLRTVQAVEKRLFSSTVS